MPAFNPDKFLAETSPGPSAGDFDPDKFLAETATPEDPHRRITDEEFEQARHDMANDAVPAPLPGLAGAGLGQAAGRILANTGLMAADAASQGQDPVKAAELGGGISAAAEALPYIGKPLGWAAKKAAQAFTGVTPAAMARYVANPEAVNSAAPLIDQTKKFLASVEQTSKGLSQGSTESYQTLKGLGATLKPEALTAPLSDAAAQLESLGSFGPERKGAIKYLQSLASDVAADSEQNGGTLNLISWDKGKSLINVLDKKMEVAAAQGADAQVLKAFGDARKAIDTSLKETSPEYAAQMADLSKKTQIYKALADKFRTDTGAMNTLKRVQTGKDPFAAEALSGYDKQFGTTFGEDLQNSAANQSFSRDTTNGARKTLAGTAIGGAIGGLLKPGVGHAVGGAVGAGAGALADKFGGQAVKIALDAGINLEKLAGSKYAVPIMTAAQRGPQALAVAHYITAQSQPEYQKLNEKNEESPKRNPQSLPAIDVDDDD